MAAKDRTESDMSKPIEDFFTNDGYVVRNEVEDCDVTAIKEDILIVIELKKNLTVKLLSQAVKRQKTADLVYIAVLKPKKMKMNSSLRDIYHLIRRLELGLIWVSFVGNKGILEIAIEPEAFDRKKIVSMNKKKRDKIINEIKNRHKNFNVGGSVHKKLITAYREQAIFIACCLKEFGSMSPASLKKLGTDEKKTSSILYVNHYGWFDRVGRGIYKLNDMGYKALETYKEIAEYYYEKINQNT
ncbi:hypothetical protein BJV85_000884 [Clostridium acetobutylicum]|uniref:Uncharacterized protein n=1 Tax=Clostridium acetobutylicum (strain ATCC 824 / DSM 792 / JCM 1419 / IAM 19013 / LMG 5710 / NBRC 13948 / NRRL B-527 / VKM B-1787 / 2291 / W) TaxID=272562 RepID=Q97EU3_CLOAB|nr:MULTISPECIES: DUF2161 domain-containing phosphodiesterase [Clostridium]AAK80954.1 Hypothetical protein CA_C3013 [Clostridium acetobutylicum ATCC 824]ADZ22056.1 Conserved hypothetical protein [Clostridium acetobutylicum EA 2018]AEI32647.1 hypothetical protein SMB_G3049 [Clostridium acetobutylicum DSM 1731]AWV78635.1 hypothetical protein DK921_00620 [Clostridium acetobutylicum]MBC2393496.1 DUF2161 domain-containing phosphodiesterase [Clostridium acetobutylicum]